MKATIVTDCLMVKVSIPGRTELFFKADSSRVFGREMEKCLIIGVLVSLEDSAMIRLKVIAKSTTEMENSTKAR